MSYTGSANDDPNGPSSAPLPPAHDRAEPEPEPTSTRALFHSTTGSSVTHTPVLMVAPDGQLPVNIYSHATKEHQTAHSFIASGTASSLVQYRDLIEALGRESLKADTVDPPRAESEKKPSKESAQQDEGISEARKRMFP
ncbi:unnamed protein product [Cyclocybe aegerita]|uniref:Uncharacterized protein n=1 Tax=Cyclocybe aegerita TaxID=1973307 RepID=A0A8S0XQ12_CYCAE|nr:unnamed protein product [Cyclocybe aegerita]